METAVKMRVERGADIWESMNMNPKWMKILNRGL
jgi:hypothetical protein